MPSSAELYLEHLDRPTGNIEPTIRKVDSTDPNLRAVFVFIERRKR